MTTTKKKKKSTPTTDPFYGIPEHLGRDFRDAFIQHYTPPDSAPPEAWIAAAERMQADFEHFPATVKSLLRGPVQILTLQLAGHGHN